MLTALDAPESALDEHERNFVAKIREHGWFRTGVSAEDDSQGFSYTTGFSVTLGVPEVIAFSLRDEIAHDVFWDIFRDSKDGRRYTPGLRADDVLANLPVYFFNVAKSHYREHLGWSRWFYAGDDFSCLQMIWADPAGLFPWQSGFDERFRDSQVDLTENGWINELTN